MSAVAMSEFARTIYKNKYAMGSNGHSEEWSDTAARMAGSVVRPYLPELEDRVRGMIEDRKLMPGGRYLYAAGRKYPQVNNCFLFSAEDSREGWGHVADWSLNSLMTGGGVGVVYSKLREYGANIGGLGGKSQGPLALMQIVNEQGRHTEQGNSRRSAIWAGLHWNHPDVFKFIKIKDWSEDVHEMKRKDFSFPAPMDGTNVSVILDDQFFEAYNDPDHRFNSMAQDVYWETVRHMLRTGEPGFSVDIGENAGEHLRNAPVHGDTRVLTDRGYARAEDLCRTQATVWTGKRWARGVRFKRTGRDVETVRVSMTGDRTVVCDPTHPFLVERWRGKGRMRRRLLSVDRVPASDLKPGDVLHVSMPVVDATTLVEDAYALGFIVGDGSLCASHRAEATVCDKSKRPALVTIKRSSWFAFSSVNADGYERCYFKAAHGTFPDNKAALIEEQFAAATDEVCSFIAGWFDADGNWAPKQRRIRLSNKSAAILHQARRLLEQVGIVAHVSQDPPSGYTGERTFKLVVSTEYNRRFAELIPCQRVKPDLGAWDPYRSSLVKVLSVTPGERADVYCCDVGVEEHSFMAEGVIVSNCTEVTSRDNLDMCNLLSLNMARIESLEEFVDCVDLGTAFLLCGTLYSKLPVQEMYAVREKNRRLGLGLMGMHEWLLRRGYKYEVPAELKKWLEAYTMSGAFAHRYADKLSVSRPVATRSIAPTGTISIVAETTSGIEPVFAVAYKRRYLVDRQHKAQYVVDATARKLIESGVDPDLIEDAYTLAEDVERRIQFQVDVQKYVDHGISSTINLPEWGSSINNGDGVTSFGRKLMKYLPEVRGITAYPDGSRGGQPLSRVSYREAIKQLGVEFVDHSDQSCKSGVCGN